MSLFHCLSHTLSHTLTWLLFSDSINLKWKRLTVKYLNDAMIQQRMVQLKWTPERFEKFMDNHIINAQVAFGVKVTATRISSFLYIVSSAFALIFYFILREELRVLKGTSQR